MTETLRTKKYAICRHGISLLDRCVDCELRLAMREINRWGPVVAEARRVVEELTERVGQTTEEQR
jgi:hypothetical protein